LTYPSEKYEFVNGKDDIPYMKWKTMENKTCSKPPTSYIMGCVIGISWDFMAAQLTMSVYNMVYGHPSHFLGIRSMGIS